MKTKNFALLYCLDGKGGLLKKQRSDTFSLKKPPKNSWLHFFVSDIQRNENIIPAWVSENIKNMDIKHPQIHKNKIIFKLRYIFKSHFISVHFFLTEYTLITLTESPLNLSDIDKSFKNNRGPKDILSLVSVLTNLSIESLTEFIEKLEEKSDDLEENLITLQAKENNYQSFIDLHRQLISFRRFIFPEQLTFNYFSKHHIEWINSEFQKNNQENLLQLHHILETTELLEKRIRINQDSLSHTEDKQTQKNMYMLSIVSGIFLPLSFLTGVFGMNLNGIPFGESSYGFIIINFMMILVGLIILFLFKKLKWI